MTHNAVIYTSPPRGVGVPYVIPHHNHLNSILTMFACLFVPSFARVLLETWGGMGKWSREVLRPRVEMLPALGWTDLCSSGHKGECHWQPQGWGGS